MTQAQRATRKSDPTSFRFFICPTLAWLPRDSVDEEEVWSRGELAGFLEDEAEVWVNEREFFGSLLDFAKYGYRDGEDLRMLEEMEKLPCTAIGMWLFPTEAFKEPTIPHRVCFDVRTARPGLFLFDV